MSKLLLNEKPLLIMPKLACKIGLNESIILQQLHYWLETSSHFIDGRKWIYNSIPSWKEQFPFWSLQTVKRTLTKLKNEGLVITNNYNKMKMDKTLWYSIDYIKLSVIESESDSSPSDQNDPMKISNWSEQQYKMNRAIPEITTEITTENKTSSVTELKTRTKKTDDDDIELNYLNFKINKTLETNQNINFVKSLLKHYKIKKIHFYLDNWDKYLNTYQINNKIAYLKTLLENNSELPIQNKKGVKNDYRASNTIEQINNFKQRDCNEEELEQFYNN